MRSKARSADMVAVWTLPGETQPSHPPPELAPARAVGVSRHGTVRQLALVDDLVDRCRDGRVHPILLAQRNDGRVACLDEPLKQRQLALQLERVAADRRRDAGR